jgi:serine/threonine-protein kinase
MSFNPAFAIGATITGKWQKRQYRIERLLGEGANGRVYLVSADKRLFAMKMGFDSADHQSEINVLTALSRDNGYFRDFLRDVDDFEQNGTQFPFYVMRWVKGEHLAQFISRRGRDWIWPVGTQLLKRLALLHKQGWVFGDLKLDNILVGSYGEVELVDFGGATQIGRAVRQFTELYDRGHWGAGTRSADQAYDIFSFAIVILQLTGRGRKRDCFQVNALPQERTQEALLEEIAQDPGCRPYRDFLSKAVKGEFASTIEAMNAWREASLEKEGAIPRSPIRITWLHACFFAALVIFVSSLLFIWK